MALRVGPSPERVNDWTATVFIAGIGALLLVTFGWEFLWRHGEDPTVFAGATVLTAIPLLGRAAIRVIRAVKE